MLKTAKLFVLQAAERAGGCTMVANSRWRRNRLLILCYHGVARADEHLWNPQLYLSPALFEERLQAICRGGFNVVPLGPALQQLHDGELPARSLCITFDDGFADFYSQAYPLLRKYGFPASVYLTSYYSSHQLPVFDVMCSYLLWKGRARTLDSGQFGGDLGRVKLASGETRARLTALIRHFAASEGLSSSEKDLLLSRLATELGVDYGSTIGSRILHIMSADELRQLDPALVQLELHTHRHRVPLNEELFKQEIAENRDYIARITDGRKRPVHFCYPSGVTHPGFLPWLDELGIVSATTCEPGLSSRRCNLLSLPRFLDSSTVSPVEFSAWLAGFAHKLPRRNLVHPAASASGLI
ncbi:polysaccharide deacetylase family protein [Mesorhizobium sp. BAC0120]|uniref:polysaccharide deacetylase family protein n=1 Tax=Mesorhizobium sp. BAC0120 TaxID=3090670 RepID=UPI00298D249A|nr:polysaccharide deacetylase family protein [Mesorhizobium sp. BAC0120]MDW6023076.1 polysaccharide deacetylase family protein [Mesorhizobium sp. BAC0120]